MEKIYKFLLFIIFGASTLAFAASITPAFPTSLNNFSEGDVIEEEDWNALEETIGITGSAVTTSLTYKIGVLETASDTFVLIGTTSIDSITDLDNLNITESQISDLAHYTDSDTASYINSSTTLSHIDWEASSQGTIHATNYTDTTYSSSGDILDLTGTTFSVNAGTLTNDKICKYITGTGLVCDYTDITGGAGGGTLGELTDVATTGISTFDILYWDGSNWVDTSTSTWDTDTTYTAGGTLQDLTSSVFSINEGTLTDGKICTYESGTGLVCNYTDISGSGGGSGYWATTTDDLVIYPTDTTDVVVIGGNSTTTNWMTGDSLEVQGGFFADSIRASTTFSMGTTTGTDLINIQAEELSEKGLTISGTYSGGYSELRLYIDYYGLPTIGGDYLAINTNNGDLIDFYQKIRVFDDKTLAFGNIYDYGMLYSDSADSLQFTYGPNETHVVRAYIDSSGVFNFVEGIDSQATSTFTASNSGSVFDGTQYDVSIDKQLRIDNMLLGTYQGTVDGVDYTNTAYIKNIANPTSEISMIFADADDEVRFALPESGADKGTYNPHSMIIAGPWVSSTVNYITCSYWGFWGIDCDTTGTGADLGVQDDLQVLGSTLIGGSLTASSTADLGIVSAGTWNGTAIEDTYITKTGDWTGTLDNYEASDLLANSFSTTSADFWETQQTSRFSDDLSDDSTSDLAEGTNLYYTDVRVADYINSSTTMDIDPYTESHDLLTLTDHDFSVRTGTLSDGEYCTYTTASGLVCNSTPGGAGTVTSVDMAVPTGLTISGNPITGAGTLTVGLDTGYVIATSSRLVLHDTAYSWGDHGVEGYLTSYTETDPVVKALTGIIVSNGSTISSITDNSTNWNTAFGWSDHVGLYDVLGQATSTLSSHTTTYNHANYDTAYSWGNHTGLYDILGQATSTLTVHTTDYNHANYDTAFSWGDWNTNVDISTDTNLTVSATGIELALDDIALTSGYEIPTTSSTTNWNNFYDTPSTVITAGTNLSWSGNTLSSTAGGTSLLSDLGTVLETLDGEALQASYFVATSTTATSTFAGGAKDADGKVVSNSATFIVSTNYQTGDYTDIQTAIDNLPSDGGIVHVKAGTYTITSPITFGSYGVTLQGEGNGTIIQFDGTSMATATKMVDTTQRSGITIKDLKIINSGTEGNGVAIDFSYFAISKVQNVTTWGTKGGIYASGITTLYNDFENVTINISGTDSYGIFLDTIVNENTIRRARIITTADSTGIIVEGYDNSFYDVAVESGALIGIDVRSGSDGTTFYGVYLEANQTNFQIASGVEAVSIYGGFIGDATTANIVDNGALGFNVSNVKLQYNPANYIDSNVGIGTSSPYAKLSVAGDTSGTIAAFVTDTGTRILEMLNTGVTTLLGSWNFGEADSLEIPNGASPTVNSLGEMALDTTDNQLLIADSGNTARVFGRAEMPLFAITIASTSVDFVSGGVIPIAKNTKDGRDITQYRCHVISGTSVVINVSDGTNDTETITCVTTQTSDTDVSNNSTFTADELWELQFGTVVGAVDYLVFEAYGYITVE